MKSKPWTPQEELIVVKVWDDISEDSTTRNTQSGDRILEGFRNKIGKGDQYYTNHQLNSKFQEVAKFV